MITLPCLITAGREHTQVTTIEDMIYLDIHVMLMEGINGAKPHIGPGIMQIIATHCAIGKRAWRVIHVAHNQDITRGFINQLAHSPCLMDMLFKTLIQLAVDRLDAPLASRRNSN